MKPKIEVKRKPKTGNDHLPRPWLPRERLPLPSLVWGAISVLAVTVSATVAVLYSWKMGAPSGMAIPFIAFALVVIGVKSLGLAITFGRGHWLAGLLVTPLVLAAYAFSVDAGHKFAAENLYTATNKTDADNTAFEAQRDKIEAMRAELRDISERRDMATIKAEIEQHKQSPRWASTKGCVDATVKESFDYCQAYFGLQTALAAAEKRDRLMADLPAAAAILIAKPSSSGASHAAGPVAALVSKMTGYDFGSREEFFALLIVLLIELGDITCPLGFCHGGASDGQVAA